MFRIRKNDVVEVLAGDDVSKRGRVLQVLPDRDKVVVENIAVVTKHLRPSQQAPQGGRIRKEMPMALSNVALLCPHCDRGVKVAVRRNEAGNKVRVCKKCGNEI